MMSGGPLQVASGRLVAGLLAGLVLAGMYPSGAQAGDAALPEIVVPKVATVVVLDGKGGDPAWERAVRIDLRDFWQPTQGAEPAARTRVSLLHDGETFYLAFDCEDDDIRATCADHDGQTFRDDCVELFFGADDPRGAFVACLEINAIGTVADYYYQHADWINYRFESRARVEVSRSPHLDGKGKGYRVEVAVPFVALQPIVSLFVGEERGSAMRRGGAPERLRANFARWDRGRAEAGKKDRFTIWSDPQFHQPHPHRPERMGWLRFEP
ncbi:protein of unknown function (DUF1083) [Opitutaceae bacterium TAV1]|nr:hypothetical protein OPIT5_15170 [Opitutaceae bacterium TAV5]EIP97823.1 protein of unknown function (DUF1083) [Opitutaceae bacterium TAV1]